MDASGSASSGHRKSGPSTAAAACRIRLGRLALGYSLGACHRSIGLAWGCYTSEYHMKNLRSVNTRPAVLAGIVVALFAAACGGGSSAAPPPTATASQTVTAINTPERTTPTLAPSLTLTPTQAASEPDVAPPAGIQIPTASPSLPARPTSMPVRSTDTPVAPTDTAVPPTETRALPTRRPIPDWGY